MPSYFQEAPPLPQVERGQTGAGQTIPLSKHLLENSGEILNVGYNEDEQMNTLLFFFVYTGRIMDWYVDKEGLLR